MAPICLPVPFVFIIMGFQGHVLHLANDINPTVLPVIGMPRSNSTILNQQWELVAIDGPVESEGFMESGVGGGVWLSAQTLRSDPPIGTGRRAYLSLVSQIQNPTCSTETNIDPGRPRLAKVGQDRHTTVGEDRRRRRSSKVGTSVPTGGSECSETPSAPASVQATGQRSTLFFDFGNCVNSTAGPLLVPTGNMTLALTAWPMQSPDLRTPVHSPFDFNFDVIAELCQVTYEEYLGLESQIWTFIPARMLLVRDMSSKIDVDKETSPVHEVEKNRVIWGIRHIEGGVDKLELSEMVKIDGIHVKIDKELVEKGARRLFGDKELMFPPSVPTSTAPPLNDNTSLSAENWNGGTLYMVFHPPSTNLVFSVAH
ncbi:hypothetical protein B0H19DRAFT_1075596 [Mycena capillaripes]|nr:hypothetical protein B0H19DRAFT_1075596 [Mycena capillaripes]